MDKFLEIAAEWWLTWVFGILAGYLAFKVKSLKDKQIDADKRQAALESGVQALLRGEIIRSYEKYHERGKITVHGLDATTKAYEAYHALGGNGCVTEIMKDMQAMEVEI